MKCVFCGYREPMASETAGYIICSTCTMKLYLLNPEKRLKLYLLAIREGYPEKARAIIENFSITGGQDLIDLIKRKGIRKTARLAGLQESSIRRWIRKGTIPPVYARRIETALQLQVA